MPETIDKTMQGRIIGGIFTDKKNADAAVKAFHDLGIKNTDIQLVVKLDETRAKSVYMNMLADNGGARDDAEYFNGEVQNGKILVVVYHITDPGPVIDIFDKYKAEYNPSGARNVRSDVVVMTTGAVAGAAVGGVAGGAVAGPVGAVAGAAAGAVVGGGSGAAAGKALEHTK